MQGKRGGLGQLRQISDSASAGASAAHRRRYLLAALVVGGGLAVLFVLAVGWLRWLLRMRGMASCIMPHAHWPFGYNFGYGY
jgi:hypothetical protein